MLYQQFFPDRRLQDHVKYFWVLGSEKKVVNQSSFRIIPDGSPGIIFQEECSFTDQFGNPLPQLFVYGQTTMHSQQKVRGSFKTIGAYFHPQGIKSLFGVDAQYTTDQNIELSDFLNETYLSEQLSHAESDIERIRLISKFLLNQLEKNGNKENSMATLVTSQIMAQRGTTSLSELYRNYPISKRTLERKFLRSVGVPAKFFARLVRFQSVLDVMREGDFGRLSNVAYMHNYADQCHFIRDFKELAGSTPSGFIRQCEETLNNYPQLIE